MRSATEGNLGTSQELAQVFTPLTGLAGPNRARGLASGGGASLKKRKNSPERLSGCCRPLANHCQSTNPLNTTPVNSLQTYGTAGQGTRYPQNFRS